MRKSDSTLTQSRLQEVLDYNPETGEFRRKVATSSRAKVGAVAGGLNIRGYWQISVDNEQYYAHRLAWLYMTGEWPDKGVDHRNGVITDNRICNLREASNSQNGQNSLYSRGCSRYRGVCWNKRKNKWLARIVVNGKQIFLGYFSIEELAAASYQEAQRKFHPFARET
jgi:hypothetical protein